MAVAAYNDYVYTSSDSGSTWTKHVDLGKRYYISIAGSANNSVLLTGGSSSPLFISKDYGNTWINTTVDPVKVGAYGRYSSLAASHDGSVLYAVDHGNTGLHRSVDGGLTWTNLTIPLISTYYNQYISAIATSANGSFVAAIAKSSLYFSNDRGATWYTTNSSYFAYPPHILAVSADATKLLVGASLVTASGKSDVVNGSVYGSEDGGLTWKTLNLPNAWWETVAMSYDGSLYIAGIRYGLTGYSTYQGSIYTSTNQGANWTEQNAGYRQWIASSCSSNGSVILAGARGDYMYVSLNSGVNWTKSF